MSLPGRLACVLAGGKSIRMGRDKAMLPFRGQPLIEHVLHLVRAAGCDPRIAGSRADLAGYAPVLPDLHPGCGPLSGIEAGLAAAPAGSAVLFVAVDLPLLPASFLALLLERAAYSGALATVPVVGGRPQPLCAIYSAALLAGLSAALDAGEYTVMRVFEALTPVRERDFFHVEAALSVRGDLLRRQAEPLYRWFANINTPQELDAISVSRSNGRPVQ